MWDRIGTFVLKNRIVFIILIACFTVAAGFMATKAELGYDMQKLVPADDPDFKVYQEFKKTFGEDGNKLAIGFQSKDLFQLNIYRDYHKLCIDLAKLTGVTEVVSPARLYQPRSLRQSQLQEAC